MTTITNLDPCIKEVESYLAKTTEKVSQCENANDLHCFNGALSAYSQCLVLLKMYQLHYLAQESKDKQPIEGEVLA